MGVLQFKYVTEQWVPYPISLVFAFFANPENLPRLMPRWQKTRIDEAAYAPPPRRPAGVRPYPGALAGNGSHLTLSFRPLPFSPVRLQWRAKIQDFAWNEGFCDTQTKGPFRHWRQCHLVREEASPTTGAFGTVLRDEIEYELPVPDLLARIANVGVRRQIISLFRYRKKRTLKLLQDMSEQAR